MILNNVATHLKSSTFEDFIGSQGHLFTKPLEIRPDTLKLFIDEVEKMIASYQPPINSSQPPLLHVFRGQQQHVPEDLPESKKLNMQEEEIHPRPQRFRIDG